MNAYNQLGRNELGQSCNIQRKNYTTASYEIRKFIPVLTKAKRIQSTPFNAISLEIHFNILRVSKIRFSHSGLETKIFFILLSRPSVTVNVLKHSSIIPKLYFGSSFRLKMLNRIERNCNQASCISLIYKYTLHIDGSRK